MALSCARKEIMPSFGEGQATDAARLIPVLPVGGGVPEIHIRIAEADWQKLLEAYDRNKATQDYIPADISYADGSVSASVRGAGLRLKGNTSRRRPEEGGALRHVHFGLHFSEYVQDQELLGVKRLDLKWFKDDPAYCREVFCYDLFQRAGVWTALTAGYTRLWVQIGSRPECYYGVYELMEHVRGDYVKRRQAQFGGRGGHLWKGRYGASFRDANAKMGADDNQHEYTYEFKGEPLEFEAAKAQLQAFIRNLNQLGGDAFYEWARETMDVELLLKTYAVNVAVGMWDDYWNNQNNFYFYFNPEGKFFFIPYDYDNTLGTTQKLGAQKDAGRQDPLNWGRSEYPLIRKLLGKEEWKAYYIQCLKDLCAGDFAADAAMERIARWHAVIGPYVANDTGEDTVIEDRPASWSNHGEYRILSAGPNNFFSVKASVVNAL